MAMGIVSSDDFDAEITSLSRKVKVITPNRGRGPNNATPDSIKKIIAEEIIEGASANEIKQAIPVSESSIKAYAHGANSTRTYHTPNPELESHINKTRKRISKKASRVLLRSIDSITDEALADLDPVKASVVARNMGAIIKDMEPSVDSGTNIQQNVVFYAPRLRDESDFESISLQD